MIKFTEVSKFYGEIPVVHNVSLSLAANKTHVLLGQSGSGKSTIIRLAAGLIRPDSGEITLDGKDVSTLSDKIKARTIGYLIQDGGLFPHMTCRENILLPCKVQRIESAAQLERFDKLCKMVNLQDELMDRYPRQVSGGQRQRVALIRALILDPKIIFLDEPLGALDPIVRRDLQEELREIFQNLKKTVIIVTHDLAEGAFFADSITLLKDGAIEQHGVLDDFFARPDSTYVSEYFRAQRPPPALLNWARNPTDDRR